MKKYVQQSIWPVSVFGLGFLLLIMGLSGVANIQETRRIHQQILSVEDNYRHVENLVETIRANTSQVAVLRRDRLLDPSGASAEQTRQLAEVRLEAGVQRRDRLSLRVFVQDLEVAANLVSYSGLAPSPGASH